MAVSGVMMNFPTEEDFLTEDNHFPCIADFTNQKQGTIPWREVEYNTPWKVLEIEEMMTVNGKKMVLTLQKQDSTIVKAWTTDIIKENLLKKQSCNGMKNLYILSLGLKKSEKSNKSYYDFKIIIHGKNIES